jgi:hypothetical protein
MRQIFVSRGVIIMISPVNSDKPINTSTDQTGRSQANQKSAETSSLPSGQQKTEDTQLSSATVEVDQAQRRFDIENNRNGALENALHTPEQARSLLESIMQQLAASPETAAKAQAGTHSADTVSGILRSAPA